MSLILNGTTASDVYLNGVKVDSAYLNGTKVYQAARTITSNDIGIAIQQYDNGTGGATTQVTNFPTQIRVESVGSNASIKYSLQVNTINTYSGWKVNPFSTKKYQVSMEFDVQANGYAWASTGRGSSMTISSAFISAWGVCKFEGVTLTNEWQSIGNAQRVRLSGDWLNEKYGVPQAFQINEILPYDGDFSGHVSLNFTLDFQTQPLYTGGQAYLNALDFYLGANGYFSDAINRVIISNYVFKITEL